MRVQLLDGAVGTELERRGCSVSPPLFSARSVSEAPQALEQIHRDYLRAGADAITTATFRCHRRSLARAGLADQAPHITREAVRIATCARDSVNPTAMVFGSIGPLEDCYQPQKAPGRDVCAREHGEMIRLLLDAGVDQVLIETISTLREAAAAAEQAAELAPGRWMISLITQSAGSPGILLDGESLVDLLSELHDASAVGINCVAASHMQPEVELLRALLPQHVAVAAYANTALRDASGRWSDTNAIVPKRYAEYAIQWIHSGASIIGGCCGTTPETIRSVADAIAELDAHS